MYMIIHQQHNQVPHRWKVGQKPVPAGHGDLGEAGVIGVTKRESKAIREMLKQENGITITDGQIHITVQKEVRMKHLY